MMVDDMADGVLDMYGRGYAMLGYSQFVSPLLTSLAPSYATKYAAAMNAAYVVLETPRPGSSNLHGYLATYWAMVRPELSTFGSYIQNLPEDMLKRLGENYNRVMLRQIIPGTPAAGAGFKANDIVLAVNGVRVVSTDVFSKMLNENQGKEVLISTPRQGELLELPVILTVPVQVSNAGYGFYEAPWRNTEPTDWSSLSAANITVDVLRQQQAECKCQAAYERGRLAVMVVRQSLDSGSTVHYGGRGLSRQARASGHGGRYTREMWQRGIAPPSPQQYRKEYGEFLMDYDGLIKSLERESYSEIAMRSECGSEMHRISTARFIHSPGPLFIDNGFQHTFSC